MFVLTTALSHIQQLFSVVDGTLVSYLATEELVRGMRDLEQAQGGLSIPIPADSKLCEELLKTHSRTLRDTIALIWRYLHVILELPNSGRMHKEMSSFRAFVCAVQELKHPGPICQAMLPPQEKDGKVVLPSPEEIEKLKSSAGLLAVLGERDTSDPGSGDKGWKYLSQQFHSVIGIANAL